MKLPIINGREAVPVRLLPFATAWSPLSPDRIADLFSKFDRLHSWALLSYRLRNDGSLQPLRPCDWDGIRDNLDVLQDELKRREEFPGQCLPDWKAQSLRLLPAGVFVWRDELETEYARTFGQADFLVARPGMPDMSEEDQEAELSRLIELCSKPGDEAHEAIRRIEERARSAMSTRDGDGELCLQAPSMTDAEEGFVFEAFKVALLTRAEEECDEGQAELRRTPPPQELRMSSASEPSAIEASPKGQSMARTAHTTRDRRSNILDEVIAAAVERAGANAARASVWAELESLARGAGRPAPLAGVTSGGVTYHDGGTVRVFTRKALGDRLRRAAMRGSAR